jgi:hypothetical protein
VEPAVLEGLEVRSSQGWSELRCVTWSWQQFECDVRTPPISSLNLAHDISQRGQLCAICIPQGGAVPDAVRSVLLDERVEAFVWPAGAHSHGR